MFLGDGVRSILHEPVDAQPVRQPTSYANDLGLTVMMLAFRAGYIGSTPVGYRPESSSSVPFKASLLNRFHGAHYPQVAQFAMPRRQVPIYS